MKAPTVQLIYDINELLLRGNILTTDEVTVGVYYTAVGNSKWAVFRKSERFVRETSIRVACLFVLMVGIDKATQALQEAKEALWNSN
jgi:hypothetical protein